MIQIDKLSEIALEKKLQDYPFVLSSKYTIYQQ